ncbi:hypothetical protein JVU11DRAFT_8891 [Chiua virens]|nr:hypothetical protein JVU11DRAFT_8891 [Chiua virens]
MDQVLEKNYSAFRQSFNFPTKFEYCYSCGTPQNFKNNGECPKFHTNLAFGKCGYNHIMFQGEMVWDLKIAVSISNLEDFAE